MQAIVVCFLVTGLAPYLGLKTHSTYTMFSNLYVEGGATNHFLFRPWMAPFPFLRDVVTVTDTNLPSVRGYMIESAGPRAVGSLQKMAERLKLDVTITSNSVNGGGGDTGRVIFPYRLPKLMLRALISEERATDFYVEYDTLNGEKRRFELKRGRTTPLCDDAGLKIKHPTVLRKWFFCRSVHVLDEDCGVNYH